MDFKNQAVKFWQGTYPVSKKHMEKNDTSSLSQDAIVAKDEGLALDPQTWLTYSSSWWCICMFQWQLPSQNILKSTQEGASIPRWFLMP